jgi:hypothetical protein
VNEMRAVGKGERARPRRITIADCLVSLPVPFIVLTEARCPGCGGAKRGRPETGVWVGAPGATGDGRLVLYSPAAEPDRHSSTMALISAW